MSGRTQRVDLHPLYIDLEDSRGLASVDDEHVITLDVRECFEIGTETV